MSKNKKQKRDLVIDGDHIIFLVTESSMRKSALDDGEDIVSHEEVDLKSYKKQFKNIVEEYVKTAEVESVVMGWKLGEVKVVMSDKTNFRFDIYPEYKKNRPTSTILRKRLKKWAMKKYIVEPNTEADDVVAYYVREENAVGVTTDKDLLNGVAGTWYNSHYKHRNWQYTSVEDADMFFKMQVLAGDPVDAIPSIKGVALTTAKKLLDGYGTSWCNIYRIFTDKGYDKDYMLTMMQLVSMRQWNPKDGVVLERFPCHDK